MLCWMKHKLESTLLGEISIHRWHHPYGRKWRTKEPLDESERGEWKSWLKAKHSENEDHGIWSHHFMGNRWGKQWKQWQTFILGGSKVTTDGDCNHEIKRHLLLGGKVPRASVRNSTHGKGHEEGGLAYAKAWSSLRKPPVPEHLPPNQSVLCSHLHLWLYGGLSPITISLREGVNLQLQVNKNSWAW